jgi:tetratricopeptide (TPR) repeat protein
MVLLRIQEEDPRPPRSLDTAIPRDLETVCLKSMAKEPGRRYATAAELAADLRRYLQGEPVLARPEGRVRMIARQCRRRPVLSVLTASLVLAILAGLAGVTWEWRQAEFHRRRAEENLVRAEDQRDRAVHALWAGNLALTRLASLANDRILGKSDRGSGELYTLLFEQYRGLVDSLRNDPEFLPELADASRRIALALDDSSPLEVWRAAWLESLALYQELARRQPANIEYPLNLGECHYWLGYNLRQCGRLEEGDDHLRRSGQIWTQLRRILRDRVETAPADRALRMQLYLCELRFGGLGVLPDVRAEAVSALRHGLDGAEALCQEEPGEWECCHIAGLISYELSRLERDDRPAEALALARSAVNRFDARFRANPWNTECLHELAKAIDRQAVMEDRLNRAEDALHDFRRAADLYQRLLRDRPFNAGDRTRLGRVFHQIGRILVETGRPAEALEPYRKAIELREALRSLTPKNLLRCSDCAGTWYRLGEARENLGQFADAVEAYRKCLVYQREACSHVPEEAAHRTSLDEQLGHTAWLLLRIGRWDEAAELALERKSLRPGDPAVALGAAALQAAAVLIRHRDAPPLAFITREIRHDIVATLAAGRDARHLRARAARTAGVRPAAAVSAASEELMP